MDIVQQYLKAWNDHDPEAILNCFHPDGIYIDANLDEEIPASVFSLRAKELFESFPKLQISIEDRTANTESMIASRWTLTGALPDKVLRGVDMLCIRDQKLQSVQVYFDYKTGLIFSRVPSLHLTSQANKKHISSDTGAVEKRYQTSGLNTQQALDIKSGLEALLQEQALYLKSDLSLLDLAECLNTSTNHLSQVINSQFKCNFYDLINRYRVEHSIKLIQGNERLPKSLSLALDSGFRSTSTFYSAFKKVTGESPGSYHKAL